MVTPKPEEARLSAPADFPNSDLTAWVMVRKNPFPIFYNEQLLPVCGFTNLKARLKTHGGDRVLEEVLIP